MSKDTTDSDLLNAIMGAAVDAIVVSDDVGNIVQANHAAHSMFGYEEGDLLGHNVGDLMPNAMAAEHDAFMTRYLKGGEAKIIGTGRDVEGMHRSGRTFPLHLSIGEAKSGNSALFVAILHDLTRRTASEEALSRTMRLDAIGHMTGGISHDFNNILTVIIGNLELAGLRKHDEKTTEYLKNAIEAAEMGSDLTSRLMIFARKGTLNPEPADMGRICRHTLDLLRRTLGENYSIKSDFLDDTSRVLIDPIQFGSALVNLAVNARDAMPDGGRLLFQIDEIEIDDAYMAQETDVKPGRYVRLMVSDDGEGMTPETQRRAFEPFFTTKADKNGTGLGLAMVYGFVRQSGGHITLYSEVGHGTSFGLYFPALTESSRASDLSRPLKPENIIDKSNGETILLVEDNPKVRQISEERLRALGYEIIVANDGDSAWRILNETENVDLVFSDIVMPGSLNGHDLASKIRVKFPKIAILLTSGYASDVITSKMRSSQQFEILHKPYHQKELARRLAALLRLSSD